MSFNGRRQIPPPVNEPVRSYAPGSPERAELKARLNRMAAERIDIPMVIDGQDVRTGKTAGAVMPHDHRHVLGDYHLAGPAEVDTAIKSAVAAQREWASWPWEERAAVFLKAGELLASTWRATLNAATMLNQSKTAYQAEIDSACELTDFFRFNPYYAQALYREQPISDKGMWNQADYRGLEGFVYAVTPFNFTASGGNLPSAPALMGCTVVWKPASTAMLSAHYIMRLLIEAGLPPGVINMVSGDAVMISNAVLSSRDLAGAHFTGSTAVFNAMWKTIGGSMSTYRSYPRIVGETGGKDFIVAHPSADPQALAVAIVRGAFEYQGQKCSAASRAYVPESLWRAMGDDLVAEAESLTMGDVADFSNFMGAVIDRRSFDRLSGVIDRAKADSGLTVLAGGTYDDSEGFFVRPTILRSDNREHEIFTTEYFGPILGVNVFADADYDAVLRQAADVAPYALTGSIFATDRAAVAEAMDVLRYSAGNFYVNDKPTGAVVGQQPFGGARASGTNDKAGSYLNLVRWVSPRTVKETFVPPTDYRYPHMG